LAFAVKTPHARWGPCLAANARGWPWQCWCGANHLDATTRDALADALAEFDGALLLVSHDRYLLRATVDQFVRVADGRLDAFDGDLEDYAQWLTQRGIEPSAHGASGGPGQAGSAGGASTASSSTAPGGAASGASVSAGGTRRDDRRAAAEQRAQRAALRRPIEKQMQGLEQHLAKAEARISQIDLKLAEPDAYRDSAAANEMARERGTLVRERESLEEAWMELASRLESLDEPNTA
jgi:ATP-binding cassette subfamily F protein 3